MRAVNNGRNYRYQAGFSLVELIVAVGLSAALLFGVLQIFDANKLSSRIQQAFSEVQESGRIATELLTRDIRMADFWGCAPDTDSILDHLDTGDTDYDPSMSVTSEDGVSGQDEVGSGVQVGLINVKAGTDILTLKGSYAMSNVRVQKPYMTVSSATIHINSGVDIPKGTRLMITDCNGGDLISNTANNTRVGGEIIHSTGSLGSGAVDNAIKNLSQTYTANAQIVVPFTKVYFIGENPDGGWSLFRRDGTETSELVRNVNELEFTYGEDTNGDGSADIYRTAGAVADMDDVIAVRAEIQAVSSENVFNGETLERTYRVTANIRNRSM